MSDKLRPSLSTLGAKVKELSEQLEQLYKDAKAPVPTLAADSPASTFTGEIFVVKQKLADAMNDLNIISQGPNESVFNYCHNVIPDVAALNIINHFDFWSAVPLEGTATVGDVAKKTQLPEEVVQRVIEHVTTLRYFAYTNPSIPKTSKIQHTSRSAALAKSFGLRALVTSTIQDCGPPMLVMPEALEKYSLGQQSLTRDVDKTAFALAHSGGEVFGKYGTVWDYLEHDGNGEKKGWRQRNFNGWMQYIKEIFGTDAVLLEAVDWKTAGEATVVDVGGSGGHDAFGLAEAFPNLKVIVEDLAESKPVFETNIPKGLTSRVSFQQHNFFEPQPIQADFYLFKFIFHDWPDKESIAILQALRPALKPGAKVIFVDYVGKQGEFDASLPRSIHQFGTSTDLRMMALFNHEERPTDAWRDIFRRADERFEVASVKANPLTYIVVIEAVWRGE
ncbi:S-adenosyl-L-methionine-dependent methyltransferase [Lophiotrema nucula]|uniref:S-adenosyl-L-methionine-dependent methyltransferase n=1 Tax=Lophiotrema nucula TaxID=690887 RepID=A0A6A5YRN2_9PLEO|nr:S-adenosyl-L-methionine-dependent methyltransferase [Lophiotrema nucula]